MSSRTFYGVNPSPPCRNVLIILDVLGLEFKYKVTNPMMGDTKKSDFLKMNPQHNIPFFVDDDGFMLNESRAIAVYLAQKYDKTGKLFPDNIQTQAVINQRLAFDMGVLYKAFHDIFVPFFRGDKGIVPSAKIDRLKKVLDFLEGFLSGEKFVAGTNHATVADFCILATYTSITITKDTMVTLADWPKTQEWAKRVQSLIPNYEKVNDEGVKKFQDMLRERSDLKI